MQSRRDLRGSCTFSSSFPVKLEIQSCGISPPYTISCDRDDLQFSENKWDLVPLGIFNRKVNILQQNKDVAQFLYIPSFCVLSWKSWRWNGMRSTVSSDTVSICRLHMKGLFPVLPNLCLNQRSTKYIVMQCRTPSSQVILSNKTSSFSLGKITNFRTNDPTKKAVSYLLASWSRVLLEKLTGSQLVK